MRTILADANEPSEDRLAAIRARIQRSALPVSLRHDIREFVDIARAQGIRSFAVRSSALHEDAAVASAAGLHSTFLNLDSEAAIFQAVLDVWASLYQRKVIRYLSRLGEEQEPAVGVLFQEFVPAESSGVLFTVNPITGDGSEMMLNAHHGLGSLVTDGEVSPDVVRISRETLEVIDTVVGSKARALVPTAEGPLRVVDVSAERREKTVLDESALRALSTLALRIEGILGGPQDIEWARVRGNFVILQSRPVTVVSSRDRGHPLVSKKNRSSLVWSNVNVGESLPGVVTPLTWSVLSRFADTGFRKAFGAMGCVMPDDAELFGNFRGRIYLNLTEFLAIASQVPGVGPELVFSLGGGPQGAAQLAELEGQVSRRSFYLRLPLTVARFVQESVGFEQRLAHYEAEFAAERRRLVALDPRLLSREALDRSLWDAERLLGRTGGVMLSAYGRLLVGLAVLRLLLRASGAENAVAVEQELFGGTVPMEASAPAFALADVLAAIRVDAASLAYFAGAAPEELSFAAVPEGPGRDAIATFLRAHGYRGPREAELMAPRWRERPELVLRTIKTHLDEGRASLPPPPPGAVSARRRSAEQALRETLAMPLRPLAKELLAWITSLLATRERLRAHVTETLFVFRGVALDASRRLEAENAAYGTDAAFFLTVDELHALLRGRARHLAELAEQRRRHHARDEALPDPPSTFVGMPPASEVPSGTQEVLVGLSACAGYVEGPARVARSFAEAESIRSDEILVVPHADVGWSLLFTVARGVVTELGGPLSHAAIVLREYGVPSVVNAASATTSIRTGDHIAVDGDRGVVRVLRRRDESKHGATS
jgi:phosphohistidine swiveling domain-containing protein